MTTSEQTVDDEQTVRIARGGARSLIFRLLAAAASFVTIIVTARGFGADGRGLYALASLAASLLVTLFGGVSTTMAAEIGHRRASLGQLHAAQILIAIGGGLLGGAIMLGAAALNWPEWKVLVYPAAVAPFLLLMQFQIDGLFQATGDIRRMHYTHLARAAVPMLALAAVAIASPGDIYLALAAWAVALAVVPLWALGLQYRAAHFVWHGLRAVIDRLLRRGSKVSLGNAIALLNYRIDLLLVAALLPLADVGRYSVAIALAETILLLSRAVYTGAYATVVGTENDDAAQVTLSMVRHATLLLVLTGIAVLAVTGVLMTVLFGDDFSGVWLPLAVLLPGIVLLGGVGQMVQPFLLVRLERSREFLISALVAMLVNLALALVLIPPLGMVGAALSTTVSYAVGSAYLVRRFSRLAGVHGVRNYLPQWSDLDDYRALIASLRSRRGG